MRNFRCSGKSPPEAGDRDRQSLAEYMDRRVMLSVDNRWQPDARIGHAGEDSVDSDRCTANRASIAASVAARVSRYRDGVGNAAFSEVVPILCHICWLHLTFEKGR